MPSEEPRHQLATSSPLEGKNTSNPLTPTLSRGQTLPSSTSEGEGSVTVRTLAPGEEARWDAFVERCPEATFFHRAGWREVIERAFGHPTWFFKAEAADGTIEGLLPLARVRSRLFGDALTALPFCVYGGIAVDTERAAAALDEAAVALAEELRVGHLEYRHRRRRFPERLEKGHYVTFCRTIDPDPEVNLKAIPRKQRAMVRKGIKTGLTATPDDDIGRFYYAYANSQRRLGTPVPARRYFEILREVFGSDCDLLTVTRSGTLIASVLSFYFRDQVLPYYGGGTAAARSVAGNDYLYWALMEHARERGCRLFDYGRSKVNAGSYRFKKHWGFEPEPLHYECRLVRARALPDNSPQNPTFRPLIALWQRLPLPVANTLGPPIVKRIG